MRARLAYILNNCTGKITTNLEVPWVAKPLPSRRHHRYGGAGGNSGIQLD